MYAPPFVLCFYFQYFSDYWWKNVLNCLQIYWMTYIFFFAKWHAQIIGMFSKYTVPDKYLEENYTQCHDNDIYCSQ